MPTSSKVIAPDANLAPVYAYTSLPWNVYDFSESFNLFIASSISLTSSIPYFSATNVNVPLSGVTKYWPVFVFSTTDFLSVPTPGSIIYTKTVPFGQYSATPLSQ